MARCATTTTPRPRSMWTPAEDAKLKAMVHAAGDKVPRWSEIAKHLQGRNRKDVRKRWSYCLNPTLTKGAWSRQEDTLLRAAVQELGTDDWVHVASRVGSRTGDQCAKRWRDVLDPNIVHDRWTSAEDAKLVELTKKLGHNWSLIATHFPGRRGVQCRNRSHSLTKRLEAHGSLENTGQNQTRGTSSTQRRTGNSTGRTPFQPFSSNVSAGPTSSYHPVDAHLVINNSASSLMLPSIESPLDSLSPMWPTFPGCDRVSTTPVVPSVINPSTTSAAAYNDTSARHLVPLSPSQILHSPPMSTHANVQGMFSMLHNTVSFGAPPVSGPVAQPSPTTTSRYYSDACHNGTYRIGSEHTIAPASLPRALQVPSMGQYLGPTSREATFYQPMIQRNDSINYPRDVAIMGSCAGPSAGLYGHQDAYGCTFSGPGPTLSYLPASSPRQFNDCPSASPASTLIDTKAHLLPISFPSPGPNIITQSSPSTNSQGFIMPQPLPAEEWHCNIKCEPSPTSLSSPGAHSDSHAALIQENSPTGSTGINPAMTLLDDMLEERAPTELARGRRHPQDDTDARSEASLSESSSPHSAP